MCELNCRLGTMPMDSFGDRLKVIKNIILQAHLVIESAAAGLDRTVGDSAESDPSRCEGFMKLTQAFSVRKPPRAVSLKSGRFYKAVA